MYATISDRIAAARAGTNSTMIARMSSGWLMLCDMQFIRGWCVLLADPVVGHLHELVPPQRNAFLNDMAAAGEAILRATGAGRMNYSILGNTDPVLHAHLQPRYDTEPPFEHSQPAWCYGRERLRSVPFDVARDAGLIQAIRALLPQPHG